MKLFGQHFLFICMFLSSAVSFIERQQHSFRLHRTATNPFNPVLSPGAPISLRQHEPDHIPQRAVAGLTSGTCESGEGSWITKPSTDDREYKHIKLANQLEAIVVSDPSCHSAAAALCVAAGQLDDPREVQGLAHFLEHMLFLGTHKFPQESNFDEICGKSAGYSNAWTSLDHTMYHFIVSHDRLEQVLERFAAFFSCPLFSESGTEREMNAVDSEHNKNLKDDDRRENQLLRSSCSPDHPMSRFGGGNLETLMEDPKKQGINVREKLLQFHERYYSASAMRLAVIGKEPVEKLEVLIDHAQEWVKTLFSDVPNRETLASRDWISSVPYGISLSAISSTSRSPPPFPSPSTPAPFFILEGNFRCIVEEELLHLSDLRSASAVQEFIPVTRGQREED
eukprot:755164-Hanusia_phi.AAC.3